MILDFTIIDKVDGISIYAKKVLEKLYKSFPNDLFLFYDNFHSSILKQVKYRKISNKILHRMNLGLFDNSFYYSPSHHGPIFNKNKVLTVHDITPLLIKNKSFKQYMYYGFFLKLSIKNTKKIITVSEFTKKKIMSEYNILERSDDIIVIHNGTDIDSVDEIKVLPLPEKFIFLPGVHSDYKNYKRVINALELINDKDVKLVITTSSDEVKMFCNGIDRVVLFSNLEYGQIKYLYIKSLALVYPSIIEGFGFPALEAARLKIPILTTKDSSMEEFLGKEGALYVNPLNEIEIKDGIDFLLSNSNEKMIDSAYENTKDLTWERNCSQVLNLLKGLDV